MNLCISFLSSLDNRYTFLFLGTNPFFVSMAWFHNFLVGILPLVFLPKTWIHLWKCFGTNLFTFSSDFVASSFLSHISYSSAILFTSTTFSFFGFIFFFSFFFFCSFSSPFFPFSSLFSSSFYFYHPNFPCFGLHCFLHFSGYLVIFTFPVLQLISRL